MLQDVVLEDSRAFSGWNGYSNAVEMYDCDTHVAPGEAIAEQSSSTETPTTATESSLWAITSTSTLSSSNAAALNECAAAYNMSDPPITPNTTAGDGINDHRGDWSNHLYVCNDCKVQ